MARMLVHLSAKGVGTDEGNSRMTLSVYEGLKKGDASGLKDPGDKVVSV